MPEFSNLPLPFNLALFAVSAVFVWLAGSRLAGYADEISRRTGLGQAVIGLLLLAGITSLPEVATSVTAAAVGNAPLAINSLLGSIALQVALLAFGDLFYGRHALTSVVPDPAVMLQGALNIILLCVLAVAAIIGDKALGGAGWWTWGLAIAAIYALNEVVGAEHRKPWVASTGGEPSEPQMRHDASTASRWGHMGLGIRTALAALVILAAGSVVALTGDALSTQSGLGASFMGYALVSVATSLPEASTVFASMKRGLYTMAISDILGTNILNVALVFVVDLVAPQPAILSEAGHFGAVAALIGATVTGLFLMGLAERRDRVIFRMGYDSVAVLAVYAGGLALLFTLKGSG